MTGPDSRTPRGPGSPLLGEPPPPERDRYATRRRFLKWTIRIAYGTFAFAFALPALALRTLQQAAKNVAEGDALVYAVALAGGKAAGDPVVATDLEPGVAVQAFPKGKTEDTNNLIEVVRLEAGDGPEALVAYSAICTHLGCSVYARLTEEGLIHCPCHGSLFDPSDGGEVVRGPATRPLPRLPVEVGPDGVVIAAGTFDAPVGPA